MVVYTMLSKTNKRVVEAHLKCAEYALYIEVHELRLHPISGTRVFGVQAHDIHCVNGVQYGVTNSRRLGRYILATIRNRVVFIGAHCIALYFKGVVEHV